MTLENKKIKKVAVVGIQGVPAHYGGFETLIENIIGENCSPDVEYTVFCSSKDMNGTPETYKGVHLKYLPLHANGIQSIPYDMLSMCRLLFHRCPDAVLVLGTSGCLFLPMLRLFCRSKVIVNIDGQEYRRPKWGRFAKQVLRMSEQVAMRSADVIIADNMAIKEYVKETYNKEAKVIAYGGDHVLTDVSKEIEQRVMNEYNVKEGEYAISICRIEPENNCHLILDAFAKAGKRLVFIGNWQHSEYGRGLRKRYAGYDNISMAEPEYDIATLYVLRKNAECYVHGHSAGGTNPSLVEAMFFGRPILCFDVIYNRNTTHNAAYYWKDAAELQELLLRTDKVGDRLHEIARSTYTWNYIAKQYESLY